MTDINSKTPYRKGKHEWFTAEEKHCRHEMYNPQKDEARQFKLDGEIFAKGTKPERCDWLLLNDSKRDAYYIELKGSSIPKAISQIDTTIREIHASIHDYDIYRRIVYHSGSHEVNGSEAIQWKKRYKGKAEIKSRKMVETFR